jgi:hypothetical protein
MLAAYLNAYRLEETPSFTYEARKADNTTQSLKY